MTKPLHEEHCVSPTPGDALSEADEAQLWSAVPSWRIVDIDDVPRLERVFTFEDFAGALAFTNRVGQMAEHEDHHPVILTEWGRVTVMWWTHSLDGLHRNDFVAAAKTDRIFAGGPGS